MGNKNNNTFCDWIRVSQTHSGNIKVLTDGYVTHYDSDGKPERYTEKSVRHEGSYSTIIIVRSDGKTVTVSGNFGRFNRPDNLFNYILDDFKKIVNKILQELGLPPFTDGELYEVEYKNKKGEIIQKTCTTGARISEIHYTTNFATGSRENADQFIYLSGIRNINRQNVRAYKTGATYGEGSRFKSSKIYNKADDIQHWINKGKIEDSYYNRELIKFCNENGVVRFETQFRNILIREGLNFWKTANHQRLNESFNQELETMAKTTEHLNYSELPTRLRSTYLLYIKGTNLREVLSNGTFYRHRNELLKYGIDIKNQDGINELTVRKNIIQLTPLEMPDWYQLPAVK